MAFQLKQPIFPCLFTIILFLSITSFPHAKAKPCNCTGSDQNRRSKSNRTYTMDDPDFQFYLIDEDSNSVRVVDLNSVRNLSNTELKITGGLSTIDQGIPLWEHWFDRDTAEASFSVTIVYQPLWSPLWSEESRNQSSTPELYRSRLTFLILPETDLMFLEQRDSANTLAKQLVASFGLLELYNDTTRTDIVAGTLVAVRIGALTKHAQRTGSDGSIMGVDITIDTPSMELTFNYSVWIDYDRVGSRLSVYVGIKGKPKPVNAIAEVHLSISDFTDQLVCFGLLSTMAQLLASGGIDLSAKVEGLPDDYSYRGMSSKVTITILSCVLGSIATISVLATAVACYFTSRYRRWHTDLDQLAMSMQRLPGVPTKVEFADIKKATGNFHETMKLGGGGFGTVYRCTLPAGASKTERPMDVAVKRFTRDVQNRCYDDFLAEVSIINRLRHKNIVPLVGWSYNKGEPLLVFEFMTNGSLDQHLFAKGGTGSGIGSGIKWATRYEIVRDVATGLHYVHHEYEPMVLHRDIKASNIMLDSSFRARLGDFGLACTVAIDRNSATGVAGTWGYIAPEYAMCGKATRQTDIYALGVLILEVVTGQRVLIQRAVDEDDVHITDRVWRLHRDGRLKECVDAMLIATSSADEEQLETCGDVKRLLLLGLACSNPNPSDRPTMPKVVQVIAKSAPPLEVPLIKPRFVWPPPEGVVLDNDDSAGTSMTSNLDTSMASTAEQRCQSQVNLGKLMAVSQTRAAGGHASFQLEHSVYVRDSALGSDC